MGSGWRYVMQEPRFGGSFPPTLNLIQGCCSPNDGTKVHCCLQSAIISLTLWETGSLEEHALGRAGPALTSLLQPAALILLLRDETGCSSRYGCLFIANGAVVQEVQRLPRPRREKVVAQVWDCSHTNHSHFQIDSTH